MNSDANCVVLLYVGEKTTGASLRDGTEVGAPGERERRADVPMTLVNRSFNFPLVRTGGPWGEISLVFVRVSQST